jgi:hypothetical protein
MASVSPLSALAGSGEQDVEVDAEGIRQLLHDLKRRIPNAPFDPADVCAVEPRSISKILLA